MPRVFDCFPFFNEVDVLEIRFEELYPVVDRFVVVQSTTTFRGNPKPDYFDWMRYEKYANKVELVTIEDVEFKYNSDPSTAWARETQQRNAIVRGIQDVRDDDIIILSDADEIPRRSAVEEVLQKDIDHLESVFLDVYCYSLNCLTDQRHCMKMFPWHVLNKDMQTMRMTPPEEGKCTYNAGWEFSSLALDAKDVMYKLKSFSHSEFDNPNLTLKVLRERMKQRVDVVGRGNQHCVVPVDDTWPEAVKNNLEYWSKFIWSSD